MDKLTQDAPFSSGLTRTQKTLGWFYVFMHMLVLPLLVGLYTYYSPDSVDPIAANAVYYAIGLIFVFTALYTLLRGGFDTLLDDFLRCLLTFLMALGIDYLLSMAMGIVLVGLGLTGTAPNNTAVEELSQVNSGATRAMAVFIAPIVEECLFRGVVFGSIREKSRVGAYAASAVLFSVYHVWQYALVYADWGMLVYAIQYIPVSIALCLCYDKSRSIWTPIFFHMMVNAASFALLELL